MSVACGQCDARPTVTLPAARHHRPLADTKLYCLVTGMCVNLPGLHLTAGQLGIEPTTYWSQVQHPTATPPSHTLAGTKLYCLVTEACVC